MTHHGLHVPCHVLTVSYMEPKTRFTQSSGNGIGPQILVDPRHMSDPALPEELVRERGEGKGRKTKLAAFGLSPSIIKAGDPDYAKCLAQANKYRKTRMREFAGFHGHVSAGVGALLASASLALAASRYLYQLGAEGVASVGMLKQASQLADSARQNELAAYELCAREGTLKRRQETSEAGQPWLLNADGEKPAKGGRKTNMERQARELDVAPAARHVIMSLEHDDND